MTTPILVAQNLVKRFGALAAVNDVSFSIESGRILGIGGPNGAGKTTFFDLISGIQPATEGSITFDGRNVMGHSPERLCHAGMARTFQLNAAFETMTALENVRVAAYFGAATKSVPGFFFDRASRKAAIEALDIVGLAAKKNQVVGDMPVLDRKLVMLAGALATKPKLLLMDEPVGGLTPPEIATFETVILDTVKAGTTLVIIEHVMSFLLKLAHRMLIMHQGSVLFDGETQDMLRDRKVVEVYLGKAAAQRLVREFNVVEG